MAFELASIAYLALVNTFYILLFIGASIQIWKHSLLTRREQLWRVLGSSFSPSISVLAPAFNEEATVTESVRALLSLAYPNLQVIVVNDGSKDGTLAKLQSEFELVPVEPAYWEQIQTRPVRGLYQSLSHSNLLVIDKENGGKADALNTGLNLATGELVCAIDADTLIQPDALQRLVRPFMTNDNVVAAGGTIRVVNGCTVHNGRVQKVRVPSNMLAGFQVIEYLRAFLFGRLGWNMLGGNLIISGAFGLFRRDSVIWIGGYSDDSVGEDMELIAALRRSAYHSGRPGRVEFIPDPVAWTEVPVNLRILGNQRDRWHRGLSDVLWRYRGLMLNPRYGSLGMFAYPYFLLVELAAPVIEAAGLVVAIVGIALGLLDVEIALLFLVAAYVYGLAVSLFAILLDEIAYQRYETAQDRFRLVLWAILENFGYRQLTVYWRLRGLFRYLRRSKVGWGAMERKGFSAQSK